MTAQESIKLKKRIVELESALRDAVECLRQFGHDSTAEDIEKVLNKKSQ